MNKWFFFFGLLLIISHFHKLSNVFSSNNGAVKVNKAVGLVELDYVTRRNLFRDAHLAYSMSIAIDSIVEQKELIQAKEYLLSNQLFSHYEPTIQLLSNPEFDHEKIGWIEYSSIWQSQVAEIAGEEKTVVTFSREGEGHSSISQILSLKSGHCYLWSVVGSVKRNDQTSTFWLYWETYETGRPVGNNLISNKGEQQLQRFNGVFCLNQDEALLQKVVVAPVSIYGDAAVSLDSARLYELRFRNER